MQKRKWKMAALGTGVPHDSWVVGDGESVSLHLLGADAYAKQRRREAGGR